MPASATVVLQRTVTLTCTGQGQFETAVIVREEPPLDPDGTNNIGTISPFAVNCSSAP